MHYHWIMKRALLWGGFASAGLLAIITFAPSCESSSPVPGLAGGKVVPCESSLRTIGERQTAFYFQVDSSAAIPLVISAFPELSLGERTSDRLRLVKELSSVSGTSSYSIGIPKVMVEPSDQARRHCSNEPILPPGGTFLIVHHPGNIVEQTLARAGLSLR